MKFYDSSGVEIYDIDVDDRSYRYRKVMGENELTLTIKYHETLTIPVGSYADFQGERYTLYRPENIKKNGKRDFEYTLVLQSAQGELSKYKLRNPVDKRLKFTYTATPQEHLQLIVTNLNQRGSGWSIGTCITATQKLISYNHTSLDEALRLIATEFETEFQVVGKAISLGKVEYNKSEPLELSFRNGLKKGIDRSNYNNTKAVEILFVQGGEKNINPATYGSRELLLPANQVLTYQGRTYQVDALGLSIRRTDKALSTYEEDSIDLSHIHPKRVGTVSSVVAVKPEDNLYDFYDSSIPYDLDYTAYLIAGETMTVIFQTGMLAGREFDVTYKHADRKFELVPAEIDGQTMPNATFKPSAGDTYIVFNCSLPAAYVRNDSTQTGASWDMLREAVKFKYDNEDPRYSFSGQLDGIWSKPRWLVIGGKIKPGGYVLFNDENIQADQVLLRIIAVKDYINSPETPEVELSNITIGSTPKDDLKKPEQEEVITDDKFKEGQRFTKRRFRDAIETIKMLEDAIDGFSGSINPITIQTMSLLVGANELQFRFVNSKTTPAVVSKTFSYNSTTKTLATSSGIIQHMTLGITAVKPVHTASEYRFWDIASYESPALTNATKPYYLYARCAKVGDTAIFLLSETAIKFDTDPTYYYMLVGTLSSEFDGSRSFVPLYGFTEILPGRITTDKIVSTSGETYIDLTKGDGKGEIGGIFKFLAGSSGLSNIEEFSQLADDVKAVAFLSEALQGSTEIAGGLLLTNLLMLRGFDNVVRAGMSGLKDDNIFLFADTVNAYQKALLGTAQFILRKDGTSKLGIMRINADTIGVYANGVEVMQFRTGVIPSFTDLVSTLDTTVNYAGGSDSFSGIKDSDFGLSNEITVSSPIDSFTLTVTGTLFARAENSIDTPNPLSVVQCTLNLYKLSGGSYLFDRTVDTVGVISDTVGNSQQSKNVNTVINLSAGSYKLKAGYSISTQATDIGYVTAEFISMRARGAAANECMIFGTNGFARIKNGENYAYFTDAVTAFSHGTDKYLKVTSAGIEGKGGLNLPGLLAAGSVTAAGGLTTSFGKASDSGRTSTGLFTVVHSIGHSLYSVNLTLFSSGAQLTAVVTSKSDTSFSVRIVNPSNNSLTDSAFDFSCYGAN